VGGFNGLSWREGGVLWRTISEPRPPLDMFPFELRTMRQIRSTKCPSACSSPSIVELIPEQMTFVRASRPNTTDDHVLTRGLPSPRMPDVASTCTTMMKPAKLNSVSSAGSATIAHARSHTMNTR
jgi:hypothetical protein